VKREDLTPRQREVVEASEQTVLVLGGPGTGKTSTALWAARVALETAGYTPWQRILFLTFSRTAVQQIAGRAQGVFGASRDRIEITTFHGLGYRLLTAFGRYAGHGLTLPPLRSAAQTKLLGPSAEQLAYDELVPAALRLLRSKRIATLLRARWPIVICDEFQDTGEEQWELLQLLSEFGRLILLADPYQMIYSFVPGVGPERIAQARGRAGRTVELEPRSHRDPSGAIPALATALRQRAFAAPIVGESLASGRFRVRANVRPTDTIQVIVEELEYLQNQRCRQIGVFGHSNEGVAALGAELLLRGIDYTLVGISESYGEALGALMTLCAFSVGLAEPKDVLTGLATFLTSVSRGKAPRLATQLLTFSDLRPELVERIQTLGRELRAAGANDMVTVVRVACQAWATLGIIAGQRPWDRASQDFAALARPFSLLSVTSATLGALRAAVEQRRSQALVDIDLGELRPIQLMNFHQTKGREVDAAILVYQEGDYLADAREREPYEPAARVQFVAVSRARRQVSIILPTDPHPFIASLAALS